MGTGVSKKRAASINMLKEKVAGSSITLVPIHQTTKRASEQASE
jgi:hypothetical protein